MSRVLLLVAALSCRHVPFQGSVSSEQVAGADELDTVAEAAGRGSTRRVDGDLLSRPPTI